MSETRVKWTPSHLAQTQGDVPLDWWNQSGMVLASSVQSTLEALRIAQTQRFRQLAMSAMLYGNRPAFQVYGTNQLRLVRSQAVPVGRLTYNVIQSAIDTLVSKTAQDETIPYFLTSGGNWRQQRRAKKLTKFCDGVFYENDAKTFVPLCERDALICGDSMVHVYKHNGRVCWERVLVTEMYVDELEGQYGKPRSMHRVKAVDRMKLLSSPWVGKSKSKRDLVLRALRVPEDGPATRGVTNDMVEVRESWHLPSVEYTEDGEARKTDGRHVITIDGGCLLDEKYTKDYFPFVRLTWTPAVLGYWGQGAAAQIQGQQLEINKLLWVQSRSLHLAGTFKVWVKIGSQVVSEHVSNQIGTIGKYAGDTPPQYVTPPPYHEELPRRIDDLINKAFEMLGVSSLSAQSKKPAGLNSGEALREYADIQSERFYAWGQTVQQFVIDLAKMSIRVAREIYMEDGEYEVRRPSSRYGGRSFVETINWKDIDIDECDYVTKAFNVPALPGTPAGLKSTIAEQVQAGWLNPRQARRLMSYPDLTAEDMLSNAAEDWIQFCLDKMVDGEVDGEDDPKSADFKGSDEADPGLDKDYTAPAPEDDLSAAMEMVTEYIQEAKVNGVSAYRIAMLMTYKDQVEILQQEAMAAMSPAPGAAPMPGGAPTAVPQAPPTSDLLPVAPGGAQ